jgi:hypothetical protein
LDDRQDRVFAEARIGFGEAAHDKKAAFGALDDFNMLAGSAQAGRWRNLHGASLARKREQRQSPVDGLSIFQV